MIETTHIDEEIKKAYPYVTVGIFKKAGTDATNNRVFCQRKNQGLNNYKVFVDNVDVTSQLTYVEMSMYGNANYVFDYAFDDNEHEVIIYKQSSDIYNFLNNCSSYRKVDTSRFFESGYTNNKTFDPVQAFMYLTYCSEFDLGTHPIKFSRGISTFYALGTSLTVPCTLKGLYNVTIADNQTISAFLNNAYVKYDFGTFFKLSNIVKKVGTNMSSMLLHTTSTKTTIDYLDLTGVDFSSVTNATTFLPYKAINVIIDKNFSESFPAMTTNGAYTIYYEKGYNIENFPITGPNLTFVEYSFRYNNYPVLDVKRNGVALDVLKFNNKIVWQREN